MGDRVTWFTDCPKCGGRNTVENYEQLTALLKTEWCENCDYRQGWSVKDEGDEITIDKEDTPHGTR